MAKNNISPKIIINKAINKWWLFFLFAVLGGAIGFLISMVHTPRYEAVARISTSIDYTISPKIEDYQEDRVIQDAGLLMISDDVLKAVRSLNSQFEYRWMKTTYNSVARNCYLP